MKKVTIIGSGSWGIALAIHLAKMGHRMCFRLQRGNRRIRNNITCYTI